jgi:type IX secretion system PorP/SprF family membrane protein
MKIMKAILSIITVFCVYLSVNAQQVTGYSHLHLNPFLVNPGVAGTVDNPVIQLNIRNQFIGFNESGPKTQLLSGHVNKDEFGLGAIISNDKFGNFRNTSARFTYSYILQIMDDGILSLGVGPKLSQFSVDQSNYIYFDQSDEVITDARETVMVLDFDFGAYMKTETFAIGISALNLLEPNTILASAYSENNGIARVLNLTGEYTYPISDEINLNPFVYLNYSAPVLNWDLSVNTEFLDKYMLGIGYKSVGALDFKLGISVQNLFIAYAYEFAIGDIGGYSGSTHEIVVQLYLKHDNKKSLSRM